MTPKLWELVRDGTKPVATQAVFAAAIAHSPLLRDFLILNVRDRFLSGDLVLTRSHWRSLSPPVTSGTRKCLCGLPRPPTNLVTAFSRILTKVGMLSEEERPALQPVHYEPEVINYLKDQRFDEVLRAMQVFL